MTRRFPREEPHLRGPADPTPRRLALGSATAPPGGTWSNKATITRLYAGEPPAHIKMIYRPFDSKDGALLRADDMDHDALLELDPEGGVIRFAGQRALLLDAVAMGLLRKYLVENFGLTA